MCGLANRSCSTQSVGDTASKWVEVAEGGWGGKSTMGMDCERGEGQEMQHSQRDARSIRMLDTAAAGTDLGEAESRRQ